jgi:inner membrane protein
MDNITHTLVGVLLARTGLNRLTPRATLTLVLAANASDADIVSRAWGSLTYLHYHRGATHALAGLPVMALLTMLVVRLLWRRRDGSFSGGRIYLLALLGVATHPLLDYSNTYGIRPWLPVASTWHSADVFFIIDPWIWAVLGLCVIGPAFGRLINREIGATPGTGRRAAFAGLLFLALWWGARGLFHQRALAMLDAHLYGAEDDRAAPLRVAAFPTPGRPWVWTGFVETRTYYQLTAVDVFDALDPAVGRLYYKPEASPVLEAALRTPTGAAFSQFARYRFARVDEEEHGYRVLLTDLRFTADRPNAFVCSIELDEKFQVLREGFHF